MKLKIESVYPNHPAGAENCPDFYCRDENGNRHLVDIFVDGGLPKDITTKELIGRTIKCRSLTPYNEIANDVELLPL